MTNIVSTDQHVLTTRDPDDPTTFSWLCLLDITRLWQHQISIDQELPDSEATRDVSTSIWHPPLPYLHSTLCTTTLSLYISIETSIVQSYQYIWIPKTHASRIKTSDSWALHHLSYHLALDLRVLLILVPSLHHLHVLDFRTLRHSIPFYFM